MISLAITTYNRSGFVVESFIEALDNDVINEIVVVDDCSDMAIYNNLRTLIKRINHKKIKLFRNKTNVGVFLNKINAVKHCTNDWVLLLDSDNVIDNDFIEIIKSLPMDENMLYCPETLYNVARTEVQWTYKEFGDIYINRDNIRDYINNVAFTVCLNTGNNFFNKKTFINVINTGEEPPGSIKGGDACYIIYLWLQNGGTMKIVKGLSYSHRVHDGSYYMQHVNEAMNFNAKTYQKIRELNPPDGGFVVNKEFNLMMKSSYAFNQTAFDAEPRWMLLEELYEKNFREATIRHPYVLPKKIHQVWLGGEIPQKYKQMADTWRKFNPDWEYRLWTDADIPGMNLPNMALFNSMTNYGPKSDLLRYHILNEYGGVYIDTDFECLRPFYAFGYLEFFTGIGYHAKIELYPGLIGCVPHHPIMEYIINKVCEIKQMPTDPSGVLETISSYFFTRCFLDAVKEYKEKIVAFPPDYFYPFPNQKGHKMKDGRKYIKDCSYALHHWAVSWLK